MEWETGCVTDADCVPGGCLNGTCLGTRSIAGMVSCGPVYRLVCPASEGCSYTWSGGTDDNLSCGTTSGIRIILRCTERLRRGAFKRDERRIHHVIAKIVSQAA